MTFTTIVTRLTNNFFSRLALLFSKTTHFHFWKNVLTKDGVTHETSYNLAPLMGVILGFILAVVVIFGRLVFSHRIIATVVAFACYLFFGFANALYGFALTVGGKKNEIVSTESNASKINVNIWGIVAVILAIVLWCFCMTYMRPARLLLSLMSSICIARFAACIVTYITRYPIQGDTEEKSVESFDKVDLVVAMLCTAPWLILCLEKSLVALAFATSFAIIITKFTSHHLDCTTEKILGTTVVTTEIFALLIWLI